MAKNESSENYLEAILMLSKKLPVVRSVDIANELGFKKSSVSIAMKKLRQENHITVTDAGFIYLTDSGKEIANMIYERHEFISKWLIELGVPEEIATDDACQMEHVISKESFRRNQRICTNTLVNASEKAEKFITFQPFSLPFCRLYRFTATYFICCFP